jgi:hypothetical protein
MISFSRITPARCRRSRRPTFCHPVFECLEDRLAPGGIVGGWITHQNGQDRRAVGVRLLFNQPLDPVRGAGAGNYTLEGFDGKTFRPIPVRLAVISPDRQGGRLLWRQPATLRVLRRLRVTVNGDPPAGVANAGGQLLDGDLDGTAGGDAVVLLKPRPGHTVRIPGGTGEPGLLRLLAATLL